MRILFITEKWFPNGGGGEIYFFNLAKLLAEGGNEIIIATADKVEQRFEGQKVYNYGFSISDTSDFSSSNLIKRLLNYFVVFFFGFYLIAKEKPKIVQVMPPLIGFIFIPAKIFRVSLVCSVRVFILNKWGGLVKNKIKSALFRNIEKTVLKMPYSCIIPNTNEFLGVAKELGIKSPVFPILNGVDVERFRNIDEAKVKGLRAKYSLDKKIVVLFVGRMTSQKGLKYLFPIIKKFNEEQLNVKFVFIGDGEEKESWVNYCKDNAINNVVFFGDIPYLQIPEYFALGDFLVLPSLAEGSPRVVLEAYAAGLPVIATDVCGTKEIVLDNKTGYLVKSADIAGLKSKICLLLDKNRLLTMKKNCAYFAENFSWEKMVEKHKAVYANLGGCVC